MIFERQFLFCLDLDLKVLIQKAFIFVGKIGFTFIGSFANLKSYCNIFFHVCPRINCLRSFGQLLGQHGALLGQARAQYEEQFLGW